MAKYGVDTYSLLRNEVPEEPRAKALGDPQQAEQRSSELTHVACEACPLKAPGCLVPLGSFTAGV